MDDFKKMKWDCECNQLSVFKNIPEANTEIGAIAWEYGVEIKTGASVFVFAAAVSGAGTTMLKIGSYKIANGYIGYPAFIE